MAGHPRHVLLGYEPTPAGRKALGWAVDEARLRGLALVVCAVRNRRYAVNPASGSRRSELDAEFDEIAAEGVGHAETAAGGGDGPRVAAATGRLVEAARDAALIVVAGPDGGPGTDRLAGSAVERILGAGRTAPVIVVPAEPRRLAGVPRRIVVGVDGSAASRSALDFAFTEAEMRDAAVTVACGWWDEPGPGREGHPFVDRDAERASAKMRFAEAVAPWAARRPGVGLETTFVGERPDRALLRLSVGAVLLVLGSRGLGTAPALRLGPVSRAVLVSTDCPVAITGPPAAAATEGAR